MLVDSNTGRAAVTAGYGAEVWISDDKWNLALAEMANPLRKGRADKAVVDFIRKTRRFLESAWKRPQKQLTAK